MENSNFFESENMFLESPSESEITASSGLLSLSSAPKSSATNYCFISSISSSSSSSSSSRFNNGIKKIFINSRNEEANYKSSSFISESKSGSSSSALTTNNNEEAANNNNSSEDSVSPRSDDPLRFLSLAANFHEINNLKIVKKSRSKMYKICDIQNKNYKAAAVAALKETSNSESVTSTVSSEPSVVSRQSHAFDSCHTARRKMRRRRRIMMMTSPPDNVISTTPRPSPKLVIPSAYITRRAEAILKLLSANAAISEIEIRQVLGDNPTTSKALRMLLKGKAVRRSGAGGSKDLLLKGQGVKRSGTGGPSDPYILHGKKEVVMTRREHSSVAG